MSKRQSQQAENLRRIVSNERQIANVVEALQRAGLLVQATDASDPSINHMAVYSDMEAQSLKLCKILYNHLMNMRLYRDQAKLSEQFVQSVQVELARHDVSAPELQQLLAHAEGTMDRIAIKYPNEMRDVKTSFFSSKGKLFRAYDIGKDLPSTSTGTTVAQGSADYPRSVGEKGKPIGDLQPLVGGSNVFSDFTDKLWTTEELLYAYGVPFIDAETADRQQLINFLGQLPDHEVEARALLEERLRALE